MVLLQSKLYVFKDPEGSNIFRGGESSFLRGGEGGGGSKCLFL